MLRTTFVVVLVLAAFTASGCLSGCGPSGARAAWVEPRTAFDVLWANPVAERLWASAGFDWTNASLDQLAPGHYNATTLKRDIGEYQIAVGGWGEASVYGPRPTDRAALVQTVAITLAEVSSATDLAAVAEAAVAALEKDFKDEPDNNAYGSERIGRVPISGLERAAARLDESNNLRFGRNDLPSGWDAEISTDRVKLDGNDIQVWMDAEGNVDADTDDANATALRPLAQALLQAHGLSPTFQDYQSRDERVCWD